MNQSPLISIVLCSYNGERFIKEQIDSLLQQSYPDIEIVISDDASTDGTQKILESFRSCSNIYLFLGTQNRGPIENFEFAVAQAKGDYIAFSDQDDIWLPQKVQTLYEHINQYLLIYSDSELIDESGQPLAKKLSGFRNMYSGTETKGFILSNVVWGHTMMVQKKFLSDVLPIPEGVPHDIWMGFKAAATSGISYLDIPLTKYRQHSATLTKTIAQKTATRNRTRRYEDFERQLYWIGIMKAHVKQEEYFFYERFYELYETKRHGKFAWSLFFFFIRHRKELFRFTRKNLFSQVIEIMKQCRGERRY